MRPIAGCMKRAVTKTAGIKRRKPGWHAVTWLVLLAFTLQVFVTQTHIHGVPQTVAGVSIGKVAASASRPDKSPAENDTTTCPFCQAVVHTGAFFAPAAPLLLLPAVRVVRTTFFLVASAVGAPSAHSWQSRAPPQH